jgi:2,3-bisphosphoglycerate-independent phosphoglycerate mutase
VLAVTGDHSTPAKLSGHSWHAVPALIASDTCRFDHSQAFSEREARTGELGQFKAVYLMPLLLAHAGRLEKFGA